jgi:hypothetical protein
VGVVGMPGRAVGLGPLVIAGDVAWRHRKHVLRVDAGVVTAGESKPSTPRERSVPTLPRLVGHGDGPAVDFELAAASAKRSRPRPAAGLRVDLVQDRRTPHDRRRSKVAPARRRGPPGGPSASRPGPEDEHGHLLGSVSLHPLHDVLVSLPVTIGELWPSRLNTRPRPPRRPN